MDKNERDAAETAEHFESIPWSALAPDPNRRTRRVVVIVVMIVVGALAGFLGGRMIRGATSSGVVVTLPPIAAPDPVAAPRIDVADQIEVVVPTTVSSDEGPSPRPPQLYSEADLMAVLPEEEMRLAVMRAEWFIRDMFTVDGASRATDDVHDALAGGLDAVALPHGAGGGVAYVEWARAYRVEPLAPARYRVYVAFRALAGPAGALERTPVRAVSVDVEVAGNGSTVVLDLPTLAPAPRTLDRDAQLPPEAEAPAAIVTAALDEASKFGSDPVVVSSRLDVDGWRIVVLVGDASGHRWPMVFRGGESR